MLESLCHSDSAFVTLTYAEEHLPAGGSLEPKDLQNWLKRFRKKVSPLSVRYYAVGEYGDEGERPHYHLALFGYPSCRFGKTRTRRRFAGSVYTYPCCSQCDLVYETWGLGNAFLGELNDNSAQYCARYVTKKMTRTDDTRLNGRWPEFSRMSLRPGIGAAAMWDIADVLMKLNLEETQADVPSALRHGRRLMPLGRYLRRKLRTYVGMDEKAPERTLQEAEREMRVVQNAIPAKLPPEVKKLYAKELLTAISEGKYNQLAYKQRAMKKGIL